jgi:hypothetical protein
MIIISRYVHVMSRGNGMSEDPISRLQTLITRYTVISRVPDIGSYRKIIGDKPGRCIFRGCNEPIAWEDRRGENFLCKGHYILMTQWIEEARKGLISGRTAAYFSQDPREDS